MWAAWVTWSDELALFQTGRLPGSRRGIVNRQCVSLQGAPARLISLLPTRSHPRVVICPETELKLTAQPSAVSRITHNGSLGRLADMPVAVSALPTVIASFSVITTRSVKAPPATTSDSVAE